MEMIDLNIRIRDSVFNPDLPPDPSRKTVTVREGEKSLYKVWLYLEGKDVPFIESVTYTLHETFPDRVRRVRRTSANPRCALVIWTWGIFDVEAKAKDTKGRLYDLEHRLTYDHELRKGGFGYEYD